MNKMVQVLLTGSEGFVGSAIRQLLKAADGYQLTTISRRQLAQSRNNHFVINLDGNSDCQHILQSIDVVIHTAARVHMMNDQSADPLAEFRRVNTEATLQLARQAAAAGVKRFIFLSSIKVMGEAHPPGMPFSAQQQPVPADPYGLSKFEAEQGLIQLAKDTGMEVVIIRPPLVYGPGVKANFRQLITLTARQLPLPIGAVHNQRSMVALANLVDLIVCCISHPAAANEVFLVSDGRDLSTPELVRAIAAALGKRSRLVPVPVSLLRFIGTITGKTAVVERLCGSLQVDVTDTLATLNWRPPVTVEQGIAQTVTAFLSEGKK
jgi:UDP-glucose 4-epimerase